MIIISQALNANLIRWGWHAGGEACLIVEVSAAEYAKLPVMFDMEFTFQPFEVTLILANDNETKPATLKRAMCQSCRWDENGLLKVQSRPYSGDWFQLKFRIDGEHWNATIGQHANLNVSFNQ